ncbi:MAG: ribonuclease III [Pseudomonadales bacterium]
MAIDAINLSANLRYVISDISLFQQALTHRSFGSDNNERLEFLGDSLVNFFIAEFLCQKFPEAPEGQLTQQRANLVNGVSLAAIARELELGAFIRLGAGELKSGGSERDSILADSVEALIAAIYLDSDMDTVRNVVHSWYEVRFEQLSMGKTAKDAKTRLQEYLQARRLPLPVYEVPIIHGQQHQQLFTVECYIKPLKNPTVGEAGSRKQAEQIAAIAALQALGETVD